MPNRCIQKGDNEDLTEERRLCPFDTDELGSLVWGSIEQVKRRHEIEAFVERTPELSRTSTDFSFLSRLEQVENAYKNTTNFLKYKVSFYLTYLFICFDFRIRQLIKAKLKRPII